MTTSVAEVKSIEKLAKPVPFDIKRKFNLEQYYAAMRQALDKAFPVNVPVPQETQDIIDARNEKLSLKVLELRLDRVRKKLVYTNGLYEVHEVDTVFMQDVSFHEAVGGCGPVTERRGYMTGTLVKDVVGFMRRGNPVQRARYTKAYGWNVDRANRAFVQGKECLFD